MQSTDIPKVKPYNGVASEYRKLPAASLGRYSHGQNRKTTSNASPNPPPSKSQRATECSARFSALVPSTGQRGSLKTLSTPSSLPPSAPSSRCDIVSSAASSGSRSPTPSEVPPVSEPRTSSVIFAPLLFHRFV